MKTNPYRPNYRLPLAPAPVDWPEPNALAGLVAGVVLSVPLWIVIWWVCR
jgi:hypothetical protein